LKAAGEKSFEALMAALLAQCIGKSIRLCKSGYQAGIDALVENPIALEMKRYESESRLDQRELQGEITEAARVYPHLQLWVLITTTVVDASTSQALRDSAASQGLSILILDNTAAQPALPQVPSIAAVCASYPEITLNAIASTDWHDRKNPSPMPPITEVHQELQAIRGLPDFLQWQERFRTELTALPLGPLVIERQNRRIDKLLQEEARTVFGTHFDASQVVPRTAKQQIEAWFQRVMGSTDPETAIVLGERYDGKTWCVFDWLKEHLPTLPVPVFVIGSHRGSNGTKELRDHILDDMKRVLAQYERHADAFLQRQLKAQHSKFPWSLIVLDGVNEYAPNSNKWFEHLAWANGRIDLDARPCAVLVTVRQQAWTDFAPRVKTKTREICVGPYDATEFRAALKLHGLPANYLASIPATAHTMIQRPRYLSLVINHQTKLGRYEAVTPEVLSWLDACDKIGRSRPHHMPGFDEEHYQEILKELATRYVTHCGLALAEVRDVIRSYSAQTQHSCHQGQ